MLRLVSRFRGEGLRSTFLLGIPERVPPTSESQSNPSTRAFLCMVSLARGLWKRNDRCSTPAAQQIVSRHDARRILLCKHEPDAVGMIADDCLFEFVGHGLHDALLSI